VSRYLRESEDEGLAFADLLLAEVAYRTQTFIMVAVGESAKAIFDGAACFRLKTCFPTSMGLTFHFKGLALCLKMNTGAH
jgi:hypothetical protein